MQRKLTQCNSGGSKQLFSFFRAHECLQMSFLSLVLNVKHKLAVPRFYLVQFCKLKGIQGWCETFPKLIVCQMINKTLLQDLCM